jgi:hypothetical protein
MSKRLLAWIALVVLGVLAMLGTLWSAFGPDRIVLTAAQLQERVNLALPREFKGVTVERATIALADNRVALRVEVRANALGQTMTAVVSARGVPTYVAEGGELFFDAEDVKVADFAVASGKLGERIDRLGAAFRERAQAAAGNVIAAGAKAYLAARPVYRFKDDLKGIVLKAAVADVAIQADTIAVTLSLVRLTETVAIGLATFGLILLLIVLLVRNPGWGLSILVGAVDAHQQ